MVRGIFAVILLVSAMAGSYSHANGVANAQTLPLSEDIPEEVLQTQALESARSQLDGAIESPHDYAQEQKRLRVKPEAVPARLAPEVHQLIFLLRLRKLMQGLLPFL